MSASSNRGDACEVPAVKGSRAGTKGRCAPVVGRRLADRNDGSAAVTVVRTFQANWRFRLSAAVHTISASEWGPCSLRLELVHATRIEKPTSVLADRTL